MSRTKIKLDQFPIDKVEKTATLKELYRYISGRYWLMLVVGVINAIIAGASNPIRIVVLRDVLGEVCNNDSLNEVADGMRDKVKYFILFAILGGVWCYIFSMMFIIIGANTNMRLRTGIIIIYYSRHYINI